MIQKIHWHYKEVAHSGGLSCVNIKQCTQMRAEGRKCFSSVFIWVKNKIQKAQKKQNK